MRMKNLVVAAVLVAVLASGLDAQTGTVLRWSAFDAGHMASAASGTSAKSILGQVAVGTSAHSNTVVTSGLFADTVSRGTVLGVQSASGILPKEFALSQNFPNPFNPSTVVRFGIPRLSDVTIRIFDILGRQVATLQEGRKEAGDYSVVWDAGSRPSGVYFAMMTAVPLSGDRASFTSTRRMVLLK